MDVSVVIVSFNTREITLACIRSVLAAADKVGAETIVVDNASTDGTPDAVDQEFGRALTLVRSDVNNGFAKANNIGIRLATGRYVLLLNSDTLAPAGALDAVVAAADAEGPALGVLGIGLRNPDGSVQPSARRDPGLMTLFGSFTFLGAFGFGRKARREYKMSDFSFGERREVDSVMGAAFLIPRGVIEKIGPLDEGFFMYYEEVDFCVRARRAGLKVVFSPRARIVHLGGASSENVHAVASGYSLFSMTRYYRLHVAGAGGLLPVFKLLFVTTHFCGIFTDAAEALLAAVTCNGKRRTRKIRKLRSRCAFFSPGNLWKFLNV